MLYRLWKINLAIVLIGSLGITMPALGSITNIEALKDFPSPLHALGNLPSPDDWAAEARGWLLPEESEKVHVVRGVDGDTILVEIHGKREYVRLIGVDTSESVKPHTPVQCYAEKASHATKKHLAGKDVQLVYDVDHKDKYDRILAYVEHKGHDYNAWLLRNGYARTLEIEPNITRARKYASLEHKAQKKGLGVWSACKGQLSWVK